jgi:hypothetical protein
VSAPNSAPKYRLRVDRLVTGFLKKWIGIYFFVLKLNWGGPLGIWERG